MSLQKARREQDDKGRDFKISRKENSVSMKKNNRPAKGANFSLDLDPCGLSSRFNSMDQAAKYSMGL